jgi:glycosyltransferase involved in cell wall biosynthesis
LVYPRLPNPNSDNLNPMRLLVVLQRYLAPGSLWMSQLIEGLGSETVAIAARTQASSDLKPLEIPFVRLRSRNPLHRYLPKSVRPASPLSASNILLRTIRRTDADRILCHFGTEAIEYESVWDRCDVPLFVHFHGYDASFDMLEQDGSGRRVHAADYQSKIIALSSRATFIANSSHMVQKLIEGGVSPDRIVLNRLGVPVAPVLPIKERQSPPLVLFMGRLVDFKGAPLAVKAFSRAKDLGAPGRLIVAGDGPEADLVREAVSLSRFQNEIEVIGHADANRAAELVRKADVFLIHNRVGAVTGQEEALNLAVLEAMAVGTPICGTATGGVAETNVNGKTGFLTMPLDVEAQAQALHKLLTDERLRKEMGLAAWSRVGEHFNQTKQIQNLGEVLRGGGLSRKI